MLPLLRRQRRRTGEDSTWPSISMVPAVGSMKPAIMRRVVVLPQPEGPSSETNSPSLQLEVEAVDRRDVAEALLDAAQRELAHDGPPQHEVAADRAGSRSPR